MYLKSDNNYYVMSGKEQQQAHWNSVKDYGEKGFQEWLDRWGKELTELMPENQTYDGLITLNVGGGPVPLRFRGAKEEILLDNNAEWFESMYPKTYREGMTILNEDIETTTLPDTYVDVVYCRKTLEYIQDWEKALNEMCRILKVGGFLILMFHEKQQDGINLNLLERFKIADYLGERRIGWFTYEYDESTTFVKLIGVKNDAKGVPTVR